MRRFREGFLEEVDFEQDHEGWTSLSRETVLAEGALWTEACGEEGVQGRGSPSRAVPAVGALTPSICAPLGLGPPFTPLPSSKAPMTFDFSRVLPSVSWTCLVPSLGSQDPLHLDGSALHSVSSACWGPMATSRPKYHRVGWAFPIPLGLPLQTRSHSSLSALGY